MGNILIRACFIAGVIILLIGIGSVVYSYKDKIQDIEGERFGTYLDLEGAPKTLMNTLSYVFGSVPNSMSYFALNQIGAVIIVIAIWVLIFVTFSDIFASFSTFSTEVSWIIGGALALISANLKFNAYIISFISIIFSGLGAFAIYAGLLASFVVFFILNWGIYHAGVKKWLEDRKASIETHRGMRNITAGIHAQAETGRTVRGEARGGESSMYT
jgi:uncharacterized protein HemY